MLVLLINTFLKKMTFLMLASKFFFTACVLLFMDEGARSGVPYQCTT